MILSCMRFVGFGLHVLGALLATQALAVQKRAALIPKRVTFHSHVEEFTLPDDGSGSNAESLGNHEKVLGVSAPLKGKAPNIGFWGRLSGSPYRVEGGSVYKLENGSKVRVSSRTMSHGKVPSKKIQQLESSALSDFRGGKNEGIAPIEWVVAPSIRKLNGVRVRGGDAFPSEVSRIESRFKEERIRGKSRPLIGYGAATTVTSEQITE